MAIISDVAWNIFVLGNEATYMEELKDKEIICWTELRATSKEPSPQQKSMNMHTQQCCAEPCPQSFCPHIQTRQASRRTGTGRALFSSLCP